MVLKEMRSDDNQIDCERCKIKATDLLLDEMVYVNSLTEEGASTFFCSSRCKKWFLNRCQTCISCQSVFSKPLDEEEFHPFDSSEAPEDEDKICTRCKHKEDLQKGLDKVRFQTSNTAYFRYFRYARDYRVDDLKEAGYSLTSLTYFSCNCGYLGRGRNKNFKKKIYTKMVENPLNKYVFQTKETEDGFEDILLWEKTVSAPEPRQKRIKRR